MPYQAPGGPAAAPVAPVAPKKLPGMVGIWIGILTIIGGVILGIVLIVLGAKTLLSGFDNMERVPIASGGSIVIDEVGTQSVYAERFAPSSGSSFNSTSFGYRPDITVTITGPSGGAVPVTTMASSQSYTYNNREGVLLGSFEANVTGTYQVRAVAADGTSNYTTLAIGEEFDPAGIAGIVGGIFGGGIVVVIGIVILIVSAVRRSRARTRMAVAMPYGSPYGAGRAAPGWAPPPVVGPGAPYLPPAPAPYAPPYPTADPAPAAPPAPPSPYAAPMAPPSPPAPPADPGSSLP